MPDEPHPTQTSDLAMQHNSRQSTEARWRLKLCLLEDQWSLKDEPPASKHQAYCLNCSCGGTNVSCNGLHLKMAFSGIDSQTRILDYHDNDIKTIYKANFAGLNRLRYLDLSGNQISTFEYQSFKDLINLTCLFLEQNNIVTFETKLLPNSPISLIGTLRNKIRLYNTSVSHLQSTYHQQYEGGILSKCVNLVLLDLSHNQLIHVFEPDFSSLDKLSILNLSSNHFKRISLGMRESLNRIASHHKLVVDFTNNLFLCNCRTITFLQWLFSSKITFEALEKYICFLKDGTEVLITKSLIPKLEFECETYPGLIIFFAIVIFIVLTALGIYICLKYYWKIQYMYYMCKLRRCRPTRTDVEPLYDWDIYLAYHNKDLDLVQKKMLPKLETEMNFHLYVRDRDADVGEATAVSIVDAISSSKKTLVVISENFVAGKWGKFEVNMAITESVQTRRELLVLLVLGSIPDLPRHLATILAHYPVVHYPDNEDGEPVFWRMLADLVNN